MVEVDIRICMEEIPEGLLAEELIEQVQEALRGEFANKMWQIGTYHDSFVRKIKHDKNGTMFRDNFSYLPKKGK